MLLSLSTLLRYKCSNTQACTNTKPFSSHHGGSSVWIVHFYMLRNYLEALKFFRCIKLLYSIRVLLRFLAQMSSLLARRRRRRLHVWQHCNLSQQNRAFSRFYHQDHGYKESKCWTMTILVTLWINKQIYNYTQ